MTEPPLVPIADRVDDLRESGLSVLQAFDVVGVKWFGRFEPNWLDLEHEIRETIAKETRNVGFFNGWRHR